MSKEMPKNGGSLLNYDFNNSAEFKTDKAANAVPQASKASLLYKKTIKGSTNKGKVRNFLVPEVEEEHSET